jgi:hypothetical protein
MQLFVAGNGGCACVRTDVSVGLYMARCGPQPPLWLQGRVMFESDRLPSGWPARFEYMDELWVPTRFHRQVFVDAGVPANKLVV